MHATQTKTDYKQLLSRLCHLVVLSEAKKIEGVVDSLVENVIEIDPAHPASDLVKIDEALKVYFGVQLDSKDIESSISRLFSAGAIIRGQERGTFGLSPSGRATQLKRIDDAAKLEGEVRAQWVASIRTKFEPWTEQVESELWACLKGYLTRLFCRHGAQTALVASGNHLADAELDTSLSQALKEECKTVDRAQAGLAIQRFLREQTPERAQYIAQLLDGTFSFYTLFTDEATQSYLKAAIPRIKVLLDTNFLFGVLNLHDNPQNLVSLELVTLVREQKLPFELYYHEESLREMQETIARAEKRLRNSTWPPALSRAVIQTRPQDLVGLEYKFHEANAEHQIEPDAYFLKFRHVDRVLSAQGFKIFRHSAKRIVDEQGEEKLDEQTLDLISKYQRFLAGRLPPNKQKDFNIIKHDIVVWLATKGLRKNGASGLDVGAIMLSADQRLFAFDWGVLSGKNGVGVVILPSQLLQLLRPFIHRTADFDKKFAEVFSLPEFRTGGSDFSQITHRVLGFLASVNDLSEETAAAILADELLLNRLKGVETDKEIQAAIESEVLKKNAELASQQNVLSAELESTRTKATENQELLEAAQREAASHERNAAELAAELERERLEKEMKVVAAAKAEAEANRSKAELAGVLEEKSKLAGNVQQANQTVSELNAKLLAVEEDKDRIRKIWRVVGGVGLSIVGWASLLWLPAFSTWGWLQNHPHKISLYLAGFLLIAGLNWTVFAWKHRSWALSTIILAIAIKLIGVL